MDQSPNVVPPVISPREVFDADVPRAVQAALVAAIRGGCAEAETICAPHLESPELRDAMPHMCRGQVESRLSRLESRFPGIVEAHLGKTPKANSFRYLRIGRVTMTSSYLGPEDGRVPRSAEFRNSFAINADQRRLFPEDEAERVAELAAMEQLYALLCYRREDRASGTVIDVSVVFVDRDCRYVDHIDLLARVPAVQTTRPVEQVEDRVQAPLRRKAGDGEKQAEGA